MAAATKAFESVPKEELVGLLAKTNSRCRELEMRYAELKGLHQQLLEERRQLVVTKGKSGMAMGAERESVEAELHASYRDKLQELEEAVTATSAIKATLQAEAASLSSRLQAEQSARGAAERRAEAAGNEVARFQGECRNAASALAQEKRAVEQAKTAAAEEERALLERLMQTQAELARVRGGSGGGGGNGGDGGGGGGSGGPAEQQQQQKQQQQLLKEVYEQKAAQAEARHRQEQEQAAAALERSEDARQAAQEELAQARTAHATAETRRAAEAAKSKAERQELDAAMAEKDRALTRALSNYKEEVLRWGSRLQAAEAAEANAAAAGEATLQASSVEWEQKLSEVRAEAARREAVAQEQARAQIEAAALAASAEEQALKERLTRVERRAATELDAAEKARETAVRECFGQLDDAKLQSRTRLLAAEEAALSSKQRADALHDERNTLRRKLEEATRELEHRTQRSSEQEHKWKDHSESASAHEALVTRLTEQLGETEASYRQAKGVKASLEAELAAAQAQTRQAQQEAAEQRLVVAAAQREADAAAERAAAELRDLKERFSALGSAKAQLAEELQAREREAAEGAKAHSAAEAQRAAEIAELNAQLDSGKPSEQNILRAAREQANRDSELGRLRAQLKSLREMLRESHKVLKGLMGQEALLKQELASVTRNNERADKLNVEYLKNIVLSYLIKVYGDAEDDEHIKLARVLQKVLHFSPGEAAAVNSKIDYYLQSWWHRAGNALKREGGGSNASTIWASVFGAAAPAPALAAAPLPRPEGGAGST